MDFTLNTANIKEVMDDRNTSSKNPFVALISETAAFSLIYLLAVALPIICLLFYISPVFFPSKEPTPQETCSFDQPCVVQDW